MKLFDGISSQSCVLFISVICALSHNTDAKKKLDKGTKSKGDEPTDLSEAESQSSYGYGYGTKVQDEYSVATVYVHGFGTSDYEDPYAYAPHHALPKIDAPAPPPPPPEVPVYHPPAPKPKPPVAPPKTPLPPPPPTHPNALPVHYKKPYYPKPYYHHKPHAYAYKPAYHGYGPGPHSGYGYGHINEYGDATHGYGYDNPYKPYHGPIQHAHGHHHGVIATGKRGPLPGPGPLHHHGPKGHHLAPHPHAGGPGPFPHKPFHGSGYHASVSGAHLGSQQGFGFGTGPNHHHPGSFGKF